MLPKLQGYWFIHSQSEHKEVNNRICLTVQPTGSVLFDFHLETSKGLVLINLLNNNNSLVTSMLEYQSTS